MAELGVLQQAVATLDEIVRRYRNRPELEGVELRRQQINDRRATFEVITELAAAGRINLVERGDDALLRRFDEQVTRFRHLMALHQANWPVVNIDEEDPECLRSRQAATTAAEEMTRLLKEILG